MGLDFFYQVSKLKPAERNEIITDMIFLAQKKAFGMSQDFGPFGKIVKDAKYSITVCKYEVIFTIFS